jgi:hypothetical protein
MRYWVGLYLEDKQQLLIIAGVEKVTKTAIKIFGKKQEGDIPRLTDRQQKRRRSRMV